LAHRVAYVLTHGEIPDGVDVLHSCDFPPCVRPDHLFAGTHQDNMTDAMKKGRMRFPPVRRGVEATMAKLTETQVREIRKLARQNIDRGLMSKMFGISRSNLNMIIRRESWKHVK
jgi:HNH endonuclease